MKRLQTTTHKLQTGFTPYEITPARSAPRTGPKGGLFRSGFTLLETLVALSIMLIAIGTAFSLAPQSLYGSRYARNQITASYLAQEAHELIRHKRDSAMQYGFLYGGNWLSDLTACIDTGGDQKCVVDALSNTVEPCTNFPSDGEADCPHVRSWRTANGDLVYGIDQSGDQTIFTREVQIQRVTNETAATWIGDQSAEDDIEVRVRVRVHWSDGLQDRELLSQENLFDWWSIKPNDFSAP